MFATFVVGLHKLRARGYATRRVSQIVNLYLRSRRRDDPDRRQEQLRAKREVAGSEAIVGDDYQCHQAHSVGITIKYSRGLGILQFAQVKETQGLGIMTNTQLSSAQFDFCHDPVSDTFLDLYIAPR